jgi:uncharacterized protein (TIGR02646 family)
MIFVDRNQPVDGVIVQPNKKWFDTADTLTIQAKQDGPSHVITDHYKHVEVKKALEKLFHNKCAYCEGKGASQAPVEVEHYRPKGRVREDSALPGTHPGYYWLAYTWDNLLPSCTFCNQRRVDQPTWDEPQAGPAAGKADQFPLSDSGVRAKDWNSLLINEKPLLLNPCVDGDCETYFRYDIQGQIFPAKSDKERVARATATIRLCHLKRRRLRDDRAEFMGRVIKAVECHELALRLKDVGLVQKTRELLDMFLAAKAPFAGAARFVDHNRQAFIIM